jgi:hypothetical protein
MKTDQLIEILSSNVEPVKPGHLRKALVLALVAGGVGAFGIMLGTVGFRPNGLPRLEFLSLRLVFTFSLIAIGSTFLARLASPGQRSGKLVALTVLPFLVIVVTGAIAVGFASPMVWGRMLFGMNWMTCLLCIPGFAVLPFIALVWFLRNGAPTNLRLTGAIAGLLAGALGATAYAFHCPDDSVPFIAFWYASMVGFCALIGALVGPRLLRW